MDNASAQPENQDPFETNAGTADAGARPLVDFGRHKIPNHIAFFKYPQRIGKTLAGFSNLRKGEKPRGEKERNKTMLLGMGVGFAVGVVLCWAIAPEDIVTGGALLLVPFVIGIAAAYRQNKEHAINLYIGTEGFAVFECDGKLDNITLEKEVRWDEATDLFVSAVDNYHNGIYGDTTEEYQWWNRHTGRMVDIESGTYNRQRSAGEMPPKLKMSQVAELQWTNHLMKDLERNIELHGYETFRLLSGNNGNFPAFVRLNHFGITFIKEDGNEFSYLFQDIRKIYWAGNKLRIQHKNFEKTLFFFRSGNEDEIPMLRLCNRRYFVKALEKMLS